MLWPTDCFEIDLNKVPLSDLEGVEPDWVKSPRGYRRAEMSQWLDELLEIQRLQRERGLGAGAFERMRNSPDPGERALAKTYQQFYDPHDMHVDRVAVEWDGQQYRVINGAHRLWLAKVRGLRHVPARVAARDAETLARLRAEGERLSRATPPKEPGPPQERRQTSDAQYRRRHRQR